MRYLIEYDISCSNNKPIGEDDTFEGEGVCYINARNKKELISEFKFIIKRRFLNFHKFKIYITRIEKSE